MEDIHDSFVFVYSTHILADFKSDGASVISIVGTAGHVLLSFILLPHKFPMLHMPESSEVNKIPSPSCDDLKLPLHLAAMLPLDCCGFLRRIEVALEFNTCPGLLLKQTLFFQEFQTKQQQCLEKNKNT
uniref:Uncharacterized protein n=1 Tax=Glossina brevipalpis TaxID=37001 RepID=A0A1A9W1X7_9MUSC